MKKKITRILIFYLLFSVFYPSWSSGLYAKDEPPGPDSEFAIFQNQPEAQTNEDKEPAGLQLDIVIQKQFFRSSIFFPEDNFAVGDSWIFTQFIRYTKNPQIADNLKLNFDLGIQNTTNSRALALKTLDGFQGAATTMSMVHPQFENELSFTHFYTYELSMQWNLSKTGLQGFFVDLGVLPVKYGNSFYRNPVSFFERYFPSRDYIQEYTSLSFPGVRLGYAGDLYTVDLLYIPDIPYDKIGNNGEGKKISEYLYYLNQANVLMLKNSLRLSPVQVDFYVFWENKSTRENHFGFGPEMNWRILSVLNLDWQIMISNGKETRRVARQSYSNSDYFTYDPVKNSTQEFKIESLLSLNYSAHFSDTFNYDLSLGYYYNGFGLPKPEYDALTTSLVAAQNGYTSNDIVLKNLHMAFFSSVLAKYDLFSLNQHYIFFNVADIQSVEFVTWGLSAFLTLENLSFMPVVFINLNLNSYLKFYLQLAGSFGKAHSIFEESPLAASINAGLQWNF